MMREIWLKGAGTVTPRGFGMRAPSGSEASGDADNRLPPLDASDPAFRSIRKWSSSAQYAYIAVREAMTGCGEGASDRLACVVGTNHSNAEAILLLDGDARRYGAGQANPGLFPETVLNAVGGHLAEKFGFGGVNVTISDGDRTGWKVIRYAAELLARDQADEAVACLVNRFPPAPFDQGMLPCAFAQESVIALRFARDSGAAGWEGLAVRLPDGRDEAGNLAEGGETPVPPWHLPLALSEAACVLLQDPGRARYEFAAVPNPGESARIVVERKGGGSA